MPDELLVRRAETRIFWSLIWSARGRPALGDENLVAHRLPPKHADADVLQDGWSISFRIGLSGLGGRLHQLLEVEEERLLHDVDGGDALGELVEPGHAHLDGAGLDSVHGLVVDIELALVEDLDGDFAVGALLHVLLETGQALAQQDIGDRQLQRDPELGGLGHGRERQGQQAREQTQHKEQAHRHRTPHP